MIDNKEEKYMPHIPRFKAISRIYIDEDSDERIDIKLVLPEEETKEAYQNEQDFPS